MNLISCMSRHLAIMKGREHQSVTSKSRILSQHKHNFGITACGLLDHTNISRGSHKRPHVSHRVSHRKNGVNSRLASASWEFYSVRVTPIRIGERGNFGSGVLRTRLSATIVIS
jgi:hypothetical protein